MLHVQDGSRHQIGRPTL